MSDHTGAAARPSGDGPAPDELGAHVSAAGGASNAPGRARAIGAWALQLFTKQPNRWADPRPDPDEGEAFGEAMRDEGVRIAGAHDSYLINLCTPDRALWKRSYASFEAELRRSAALGLDFVVSHPGNATDGDIESGLARNAEGVARALEAVPDAPPVLLEITAGSGTSVGATFENLATIIEAVPPAQRSRVGVCFDTCHAYAAGYDLVREYDAVWDAFSDTIGLDRLGLFHLNDSKHPLGSRKDRHEHLAEGALGAEPFRRIVNDRRFATIPKVLETPKEGDPETWDVRNLTLLRSWRDRDSLVAPTGGP